MAHNAPKNVFSSPSFPKFGQGSRIQSLACSVEYLGSNAEGAIQKLS